MSGESVTDYKEVTDSEKTTIANKDAQWESPSEDFIAQAEAAGAGYNRSTGFFELNGLLDITEAQMRIILRNLQRPPFNVFSSTSQRAELRTNLWEASPQSTHDVTIQSKGVFSGWLAAEVINLDNGATDLFATKINGYDTFKACMELHTILGDFSFGNGATTGDTFASCFKLQSFRLYGVNYDIDLHWSPLIAVESLQYLVTNALVSKAKTIALHPDAYARITDELFAQAADKQINFATPT